MRKVGFRFEVSVSKGIKREGGERQLRWFSGHIFELLCTLGKNDLDDRCETLALL